MVQSWRCIALISIVYDAQTKETRYEKVPDEPIQEYPCEPQPPTVEERIDSIETDIDSVIEALEAIFGGV